jgi:hypothetical protein
MNLMTKQLSPAAQSIYNAAHAADSAPFSSLADVIAAALRAAADQVAPSDAMEPRNYLPMAIECQHIRAELLAIIDELEAQ